MRPMKRRCGDSFADPDRTTRNLFLEDLLSFQEAVAGYGMRNGLSQLLVKLTAPGIPDCYQGTELWDLNWSIPTIDGRWICDLRAAYAGAVQSSL